jgi:hypothetical protein
MKEKTSVLPHSVSIRELERKLKILRFFVDFPEISSLSYYVGKGNRVFVGKIHFVNRAAYRSFAERMEFEVDWPDGNHEENKSLCDWIEGLICEDLLPDPDDHPEKALSLDRRGKEGVWELIQNYEDRLEEYKEALEQDLAESQKGNSRVFALVTPYLENGFNDDPLIPGQNAILEGFPLFYDFDEAMEAETKAILEFHRKYNFYDFDQEFIARECHGLEAALKNAGTDEEAIVSAWRTRGAALCPAISIMKIK